MKYWFTPNVFNNIAISLYDFRWRFLLWSALAFVLFMILQEQVTNTTPSSLIWLVIFILFAALQALVIASFIFFFQALPSVKEQQSFWLKFYRAIEWCETIIFSFLLPLPMLLFFYALVVI